MNLTIITGVPGAGKTTLAKTLAQATGAGHLEADMWMVRITPEGEPEYHFSPQLVEHTHDACRRGVLFYMRDRKPVIVSNTFTRKWEAAPYVKMAREYGYTIQIIHLISQFKSTHGVPDATVEKMKARREFFTLEDFD